MAHHGVYPGPLWTLGTLTMLQIYADGQDFPGA